VSQPLEASAPLAVCAICQSAVAPGEAVAECPACHGRYHRDCWQENRGCAVYGCSEVPPTETRDSLEIPVSYWGQEEKPCPVCRQTIQAAAVRCRHCGATFPSARPETATEFRQRNARKDREQSLRSASVWFFVLSVLPCTAPLAAVLGGFWYLVHRQEIKRLPGIYGGLCLLGVTLAAVQVMMVIAFTYLYSTVRM
jgi:hypothetical protein